MNKKIIYILLAFFALIFLGMIYLEYTKPKPINWTPTFSSYDKIPYGTYVFFHEMKKLYPENNFEQISETPYTKLNKIDYDKGNNAYIFIESASLNSPETLNNIFDFVQQGNDAFIISSHPPQSILDSLNAQITISAFGLDQKKSENQLVNPNSNKTKYVFDKNTNIYYFQKIDTTKATVLGTASFNNISYPNFIEQNYGKGKFYIQLQSTAYTNYYMLKDNNYLYATNAFQYINKKKIFWDENGKSISRPTEGLLMFIQKNPPLLWAWRILIFGTLFYVIFFGKRLQRVIPIIKPLKNTSVEFTKTIANLYYNNRNYQDLIQKKIKYFLFFVREKYFIDIENLDENFAQKLHLKSGVSLEITQQIVTLINSTKNSSATEQDLIKINTTIDQFYKNI